MSHRATVWAIEQKLPALAKLVLLILADRHNNDTNRCDPSIYRVADDCGMSTRSVQRQIKDLADAGLITVHQRRSGTVQLTNFYTFNMQRLVGGVSDSQGGVPADSHPNQEELQPGITTGGEDGLSAKDKEPAAAVRRLFAFYLEGTKRNPKLYELTKKRMSVGLARLNDCRRKCKGDLAKAEKLMGVAIEAMLDSPFHMGTNEKKTPYYDWIDHLFKNTEKLEWWLNR